MLWLNRKKPAYRILVSPVGLFLLAVIFFFLAKGVWSMYQKDQASNSELRASEERLAKLQIRQTSLVEANQKLSTESGIESEIRDRLQMAKAGEKEIIIVDNDISEEKTATSEPSFLQKIMDFFTIR